MTPEEKALNLCQSFGVTTLFADDCNNGVTLPLRIAKKCAHIAVDEILAELECAYNGEPITTNEHKEYWKQVKQEIENL